MIHLRRLKSALLYSAAMFSIRSQATKDTPIAGEDLHDESVHSAQFRARPSRRRYCVLFACGVLILVVVSMLALYHRQIVDTQHPNNCLKPKPRREWRILSSLEKKEYLKAVQCLHERPSKQHNEGKLSDDFPYVHIRVSGDSK